MIQLLSVSIDPVHTFRYTLSVASCASLGMRWMHSSETSALASLDV